MKEIIKAIIKRKSYVKQKEILQYEDWNPEELYNIFKSYLNDFESECIVEKNDFDESKIEFDSNIKSKEIIVEMIIYLIELWKRL